MEKQKMEYRIINHTMDDDLQQEINGMAERGWTMFKAYEIEYFENVDDGMYIRIIWHRAK